MTKKNRIKCNNVHINMSNLDLKKLNDLCTHNNMKKGELIRELIRRAFDKLDDQRL